MNPLPSSIGSNSWSDRELFLSLISYPIFITRTMSSDGKYSHNRIKQNGEKRKKRNDTVWLCVGRRCCFSSHICPLNVCANACLSVKTVFESILLYSRTLIFCFCFFEMLFLNVLRKTIFLILIPYFYHIFFTFFFSHLIFFHFLVTFINDFKWFF